jgi:hypothetical protein
VWHVGTFGVVIACLWVAQPAAAQPAAEQPIIEFNDWWSFDATLKALCLRRHVGTPSETMACTEDAAADMRHFEDALATELMADPNCRGVSITRYSKDHPNHAAGPLRWSFTLDLMSGETRPDWQMHGPSGQPTTGSGTPAEIAAKLCVILKGQGAQQAR